MSHKIYNFDYDEDLFISLLSANKLKLDVELSSVIDCNTLNCKACCFKISTQENVDCQFSASQYTVNTDALALFKIQYPELFI